MEPPSDLVNAAAPPEGPAASGSDSARLLRDRPLAAVLLCLVLTVLLPHTWPGRSAPLWVPAAGVGVALGVWFGYSAALLLIPAAVLAGARAYLLGWVPDDGSLGAALLEGLYEGFALAAAVAVIILVYHRNARGEADLSDPRSAVCFLLIPAIVLAAAALVRGLPVWLLSSQSFSLPRDIGGYWLAQALGVAALTPPLLVLGTPWLRRREVVGRDGWWDGPTWSVERGAQSAERGAQSAVFSSRTALHALRSTNPFPPARPRRRFVGLGDWIEIGLLAIGTGFMCVLLAVTRSPQEPGGWQLWGAPLLLVVWAGIRQGTRGATLVAAMATAAAIEVLIFRPGERTTLVQGNLLAQCGTALLVAASVSWVRASEARYRQVINQVPVVLYSTRLRGPMEPGQPIRAELTFVNPPSLAIVGCRPVELLGDHDNWMRRIHPEDREVLVAALRQLGRGRQAVTCEYRLAAREGDSRPAEARVPPAASVAEPRTRWVRDVMVPQFDADGQLAGWEGMATDITEQRVLADDLRRTTSMFHTLVANLPAGVFFVSARSGRPILVNQRARQLLGQREDAAAGLEHLCEVYRLHRPDGTPYPPDELPVSQVLKRGVVSMRDDIVVHRPDGRRVPLISWAAPVELGGQRNRADAVVWVLEDLTELRQAEAARRETEGRLRTVIESLAEGLLVQDRQEAVIDCNPAAGFLLGPLIESPRRIVEGGWLREDGSPLDPEDHPIRRVLRTGIPVRNVVLGLPRMERVEVENPEVALGPGRLRLRWLLVNALPLAARAGTTPAGVVTTMVDVTEPVYAQQRVRASEERYRGLVDTLPLMLIQIDRDMNVTFMNPASEQIGGYSFEEVRSPESWQRMIRSEDLPALLQATREALEGRSGRLEFRFRARDGQERVGFAFLQPMYAHEEEIPPPDGEAAVPRRVVGITILVVDLTKERRLEQELQRAQRLELVGRLSSSIAHDFNNLLTALLGLTQLAEMKAADGHSVQEELHHISRVGEQATHLAEQILAFCKQRPVPTRRVDVNRASRRVIDILRSLLPPEIRLECDLSDRPLYIQADEIQLQQVLMNLGLNARDAMACGGRLTIRTVAEECGPSEDAAGSWLRLTVEDSGQGMTEEVRGRIFEPFFSTRERGTGLGLAIVHEIVTKFGGRVHVRSEPGSGSRFDVWLPLAGDG